VGLAELTAVFSGQSCSRFHATVARAGRSAVVTAAGSVFRLGGHSDGVTGVEVDRRGGGVGQRRPMKEFFACSR